MIDPAVIGDVIAAWEDDQDHPNRGRKKRALPSADLLHKFFDAVFLASIREEEGRHIPFSAVLMPKSEVEFSGHVVPPLAFERPVLFSASTALKIAAAFDPQLSTLAVFWNAELSTLEVWGVFNQSPTSNRFTQIPAGVASDIGGRPDFLTVKTIGPGSLLISRSSSLIGRFQAGYFVRAAPTPFNSKSLGEHFYRLFQQDESFALHQNAYWLNVRDFLEVLLSETALRGHGGTIIVIDANSAGPDQLYAAKHVLSDGFAVRKHINQCISESQNPVIGIANRKVVYETAQRIAQLATIDGALVLNSRLEVLSFGATLIAPISTLAAEVGRDGFGIRAGTSFDITRYGTRHRSTFNFVSACPNAIGFVLSQDGPVRAMRRLDEKIVEVWPDCIASMFV